MGPNRNEWQKRCTFNGFCKKVLKNEAIDAIRENRTRSRREVTFSDLSPQEENQLYTCDQYFVNDEAEKSFFVAGREITAKQLADALHSLPEEKRQAVLLYYFFDMTDVEIAELMNGIDNNNPDERGLLPFPVILAATKGDPDAMKIVLQHYASYIAYLSTRKVRDKYGNVYYGIDEDMRERLQAKLMRVVLDYRVD